LFVVLISKDSLLIDDDDDLFFSLFRLVGRMKDPKIILKSKKRLTLTKHLDMEKYRRFADKFTGINPFLPVFLNKRQKIP